MSKEENQKAALIQILKDAGLNKNIYQSNELITGSFNMNISEMRVFNLCLMNIKPKLGDRSFESNEPFPLETIKTETMQRLFGTGDTAYRKIKKTIQGLMDLQLSLENAETHEYIEANLYGSMGYSARKGGLKYRFSEDMKPHLYNLSKNYTRTEGIYSFLLETSYGIRLLQLMLQFRGFDKGNHTINRTISEKDIRKMLVINEKKFSRHYDFMTRVIDVAVDDINNHTSKYRISYTENGENITFTFSWKEDAPEEELVSTSAIIAAEKKLTFKAEEASLEDLLQHYGVGKIIARRLAEQYSEEQIRNNINYALEQDGVKNLGGYIRKAIEEDYYNSKCNQGALFPDNYNTRQEKIDKAVEFFESIGFNATIANVIAGALDENKITATERNFFNEKSLEEYEVKECFERGDFGRLAKTVPEEVIAQAPVEVDSEPDQITKGKLQEKLMNAIYGGPKLTMDDIAEAGRLKADLAAIAAGFGKDLRDYIEI